MPKSIQNGALWPALHYEDWRDTCSTLHMWTQIVGKVRVALTPWVNHSWHSALYVTVRGLTTSPMPYGGRALSIDFDFIDQALVVRTNEGAERRLDLTAGSVADFYARVLATLSELGLEVAIATTPNEVLEAVPFEQDRAPRPYDAEAAHRFWRVLLQVDRVMKVFRSGFIGKVSPVHFFWGSFDLAVTRFSGRAAPPHPGGVPNLPDAIAREAYSHEVSSAGFWPGGPSTDAAFYSYSYPEPKGFRSAPIRPRGAFYHDELRELVLPYETVQRANDPDATLLSFFQSSYEAAADAAGWPRDELECPLGRPRVPRPLPAPSRPAPRRAQHPHAG